MKPETIVNKMYDGDAFSQWLGIEVVEVETGSCRLNMEVRQEMTNGFGIAHGGITYSLADSALAFAANTHGRQSVSIETSISHLSKVEVGDVLTVKATEVSCSKRIAVYQMTITNQKEEKVADFKGTVYRTEKEW
jgi:acyl-CoA thioesterase